MTFCIIVLTCGLDTWLLTLILTFDFNSWVVAFTFGLYSWLFTITFCVLHVRAMLWCIHFLLALTPKWAKDRVHLNFTLLNFKVPLSMRAIIKLGCVCKVNKIFAKLFNGKVSTATIYEFHSISYIYVNLKPLKYLISLLGLGHFWSGPTGVQDSCRMFLHGKCKSQETVFLPQLLVSFCFASS